MNHRIHFFLVMVLCAILAQASFGAIPEPLVYLDAGQLDAGVASTWENLGSLGGFFVSEDKYGNIHDPMVEVVAGRKAVTFDGGNNADTDVFQSSFNAPAGITGTEAFSVATLMYNPSVQTAEHAICWTERQSATAAQTYMALGYGTNTGEGDAIYRRGTDLAYSTAPAAEMWHWVIWTFSGGDPGVASVYIDGVLDNSVELTAMNTMVDQPIIVGGMYWTGHYSPDHIYNGFSGSLAVVAIFDVALTAEEVQEITAKGVPFGEPQLAGIPTPADEQEDVPADVTLSWRVGEFAQAHDVYLGASLEDVNSADRSNPGTVLVSQGQDANTYDPLLPLEFGQTYYWRVDEVNGPPEGTIYRGKVWSFTVEPVAYRLEGVVASASCASEAGAGPENTVDGSGLNEAGGHSNENEAMWRCTPAAGEPVWIQFDFERVEKLHQVHIWNYNTEFESLLGFGLKDVTIEYAVDADAWTTLGEFQIPQGSGLETYGGTTFDLGGIAARSVRLNAVSNWGTAASYGLSEVAFSSIPVYAREPQPASGATGVPLDVRLSWRSGRAASSHAIHFGTDAQAVADGSALIDTTGETGYDLSSLDLDTTYYWRVDEVNEAEAISTWAGDVWSSTTQPYLVVDNFESYTDDVEANQTIFQAWPDGYEVAGNGSQVGMDNPPFAKPPHVHSGAQAMRLLYDNSGSATSSVATRTFASVQDWTQGAAATLALYFYGDPANDANEPMWVRLTDQSGASGTITYGSGVDELVDNQAVAGWTEWRIALADFGIDAAMVKEMAIGFGDNGPRSAGVMIFDDIRLYPAASE